MIFISYIQLHIKDLTKFFMFQANVNECNRVAERFAAQLSPDAEDYKEFAASLPSLPANAKI